MNAKKHIFIWNRMFTNKVRHSTFWGGKGKYRVTLIKSLINPSVDKDALRSVLLKI